MKPSFVRSIVVVLISLSALQAAPPEKEATTWNGFARQDFEVAGSKAILVIPETAAHGKPWIWRARFFGHEPQVDLALLKQGFHLAYCDVAGLFGAPRAVEIWDQFYAEMVETRGLAPKVALEGMSRGGLIVYSWAKANPEKVACIYADAPVCAIRSWPGGKGQGKGSAAAWRQCLIAYGMDETAVENFQVNPIDGLEPLAKAGVPLLHVVGDADELVPVSENTVVLERRYRAFGGPIQVIHRPGVGHHPHCLEEPAPIVTFILEHTMRSSGQ